MVRTPWAVYLEALLYNQLAIFAVKDCYEVKEAGLSLPGTYDLQIDPDTTSKAFCEVDGWTVIQSRGQYGNAQDYFYKNWNDYKEGFGVPGEQLNKQINL